MLDKDMKNSSQTLSQMATHLTDRMEQVLPLLVENDQQQLQENLTTVTEDYKK